MSELRKNILDESRRIVVKIGSRILVDSEKGGVRTRYIQKLADSVARLMEAGKEVVIVTSGAVGTGMSQLGYKEKPTVLAEKQACAAVGQIDLMYAYREMFRCLLVRLFRLLTKTTLSLWPKSRWVITTSFRATWHSSLMPTCF